MASLQDVLGTNPQPCGHDFGPGGYMLTFVLPEENGGDDFRFLVEKRGAPADATSIKACPACQKLLPSAVREAAERRARAEEVAAQAAQAEAERMADARERGVTLYRCESCEDLVEEGEEVEVRYCPHCEQSFNGDDNGRNCPDCNRPFSRKITDRGCPSCADGDYDDEDDDRLVDAEDQERA